MHLVDLKVLVVTGAIGGGMISQGEEEEEEEGARQSPLAAR